ncbi:MAG: glycine cleavage system protein H [Candidatus Ranarchaeia archaeon]|jgi:glycine cleavage system H protein
MKVGNYELKEGLYYSETHEWFKVEGNLVTMGIDDVAQQLMGEITFVDYQGPHGLLEEGSEVKAKDKMAEIESHKAVEDVFTHITGKVTETNPELTNFPAQINEDPYGKGWMLKVEATDLENDLSKLLSPEKYGEFIKTQNNQ